MTDVVNTKRRTQGGHKAYVRQVFLETQGFVEAVNPPQKHNWE